MKKIFLLLIAVSLMAFQCEENPVYENIYKIKNNSSYDLVFIYEDEEINLAKPDPNISEFGIVQRTEEYAVINPSENRVFSAIKIYRKDADGNRILAYEQAPIIDELWFLDPSEAFGLLDPNYHVWVLSINDEQIQ